jgi:hypothetical protein
LNPTIDLRADKIFQRRAALHERLSSKVVAVEVQQIEGM